MQLANENAQHIIANKTSITDQMNFTKNYLKPKHDTGAVIHILTMRNQPSPNLMLELKSTCWSFNPHTNNQINQQQVKKHVMISKSFKLFYLRIISPVERKQVHKQK